MSSQGEELLQKLHGAALDVVQKVCEYGQSVEPRSPREQPSLAAETAPEQAVDDDAYYHAKLLYLAVRMSHDIVDKFLLSKSESDRLRLLTRKFTKMHEAVQGSSVVLGATKQEEAHYVLASDLRQDALYKCSTRRVWAPTSNHQVRLL